MDQTVGVMYITPEGDQVMNGLAPPWVRVNMGHDWVGADYEAGHTFWITVTDSADNVKATAQIDTQPQGGWQGDGFGTEPEQWTPENPDIVAGDWVYFRADDGYTNTVRVGDITGVVDVATDSVSGTIQAAWFTETLNVECHPWGGWQAGWDAPVVNSTAAPDGSVPYLCQWDPTTEWDVENYQDIGVFYHIPGTRDRVGNVFQGSPPPGPRHVAVTGSDTDNDCRDPQAPCATVQHAIGQAAAGDEIRVAGGTYTENLTISKMVSLMGGYESAQWTRDPARHETTIDGSGNPTTPGDWDSFIIYAPSVITDSGQYRMWYTGIDSMSGRIRVGLATSSDGVEWTKSAANPLLEASEAVVLKEGPGQYAMWFGREDGNIYRATSNDGLAWTLEPERPVYEPNREEGSWERDGVGDPHVVRDAQDIYWMYYESYNWEMGRVQIGVVTSTDGIDWTRVQADPALAPGDPGAWDEGWVLDPAVMLENGTFKMWYAGRDNSRARRIGYATSTDGVNWTKDATNNPVLSPDAGQWDDSAVGNHAVLHDGEYRMWYWSNGKIGYATSPDGIVWSKSESNPVLTPGESGQWGEPAVRFEDGSDGAVLDGLTITGGSSQEAGGVHAGEADVTIRNCLIRDNFAGGSGTAWAGGGVLGGTSLTIIDSRIINNEVSQGASGVRVGEGQLTMVNILVADNRGAEGLHLNGGADLMNVTVVNNAVGTGRPGINFNPQTGRDLVVVNSIVYGNGTGDAFHVPDRDTIQASYSDIQGGWSGTGNIDADPMFVDAANGDYHLLPGSPAIDAGTAAGAPTHDMEGTPRDAAPDMGAYEWGRFRIFLPLTLRNFAGEQ